MLRAINLIEKNNTLCAKNDFFKWLAHVDSFNAKHEILSFAPAMTFFVLGFKDILEEIKSSNPKSELEKILNIHCHEDSQHWLWFLDDLTKLGLDNHSKLNNTSEFLKLIWSEEFTPMREMVYNTIFRIKESNNPKISLIIVEVLEAAFETFIANLSHALKGTEIYNQLSYFGDRHEQEEHNHQMGSWANPEMINNKVLMIELSQEESYKAEVIIIEMFSLFDDIFTCWFDSKDIFIKQKPLHQSQMPKDLLF